MMTSRSLFCPNCDSGNVEYLGIEEDDLFDVPVLRDVYRCEVCGYEDFKDMFVVTFEEDEEE